MDMETDLQSQFLWLILWHVWKVQYMKQTFVTR